MMVLGQISYLDCLVFVAFLVPQLLIHVGLYHTFIVGLQTLPFLLVKLPISLIHDRLLLPRAYRTPFTQQATLFEDLVIRCVRRAFANIPSWISKVFFSKWIALPFLKFRLLRHGYMRWPVSWREIKQDEFRGLWILEDESKEPDIVIFYIHGGGFSLGSSYFYLEFLLDWVLLLKESGFRNPALFALDYTLVPNACYPTQLHQTTAAYTYAVSTVSDASKVCVAGDSAGAALILSLLLGLSREKRIDKMTPGMAVAISPWVTLVSPKDRNTSSDYLDAATLHHYARQYVGNELLLSDPVASPGNCVDLIWWKRATPLRGFYFIYGAEEVFAPEVRDLITLLHDTSEVTYTEAKGGIHAWPVANLFLKSTKDDRRRGLVMIVQEIRQRYAS